MTATPDTMPGRLITVTAVTDNQAPTADHYHVIAVQDWGGSQEHARWWDDFLTLAEAKQLAADIIRADTPNRAVWDENQVQQLRAEFGDRFNELVSTNVAPGWEAIWIVTCDDHCVIDLVVGGRDFNDFEPYWTASEEAQK